MTIRVAAIEVSHWHALHDAEPSAAGVGLTAGVFRKNAPFVEHNHVVRALVPRRTDQALN